VAVLSNRELGLVADAQGLTNTRSRATAGRFETEQADRLADRSNMDQTPSEDKIVGHKTFKDGPIGFRHEPLRASEAAAIMAAVDAATQRRAELMPDEQTAIRMLFEAQQRLKELGWREAIYCPKDGSEFVVIEPGSTGIHSCTYVGEWPYGNWFVHDEHDVYSSRPILFRMKAIKG
jgi:hypothetical protein